MKIKKGNQVEITAGKDSGKRGEVLYVFPRLEKIVVKGANIMKRHVRAKRDGEKGQRIEKEAPLHVSNVMLVCPHTNALTRIGYRFEGGEKVRVSKKSGKVI
ncbi:MAG: 50S ribosomal protein L24 [Candidatus Moranbacteria bacterium RIFCSPLOWO2_02_FULL_48_19]|nr:MAG: 50S ribosomal protein L24 [Candidatus Moranbacteria bacterium RIFCSPLOWO2_02_FULL_48_19]OGI30007.1 MAG: 50S ribosomal protein L24 [Candidatus Moranbacteria bacterium RIFCSPLOWO2_12_FULL_48_12]